MLILISLARLGKEGKYSGFCSLEFIRYTEMIDQVDLVQGMTQEEVFRCLEFIKMMTCFKFWSNHYTQQR